MRPASARASASQSTPASRGYRSKIRSEAHPCIRSDVAVERLRAGDAPSTRRRHVMLIGRAECFLVGKPDIELTRKPAQSLRRSRCRLSIAPGIKTVAHIRAVVEAVHPKPVNLWSGRQAILSLAQIADLGVRRVSVGGALARAAWAGFMNAARKIAEQGSSTA